MHTTDYAVSIHSYQCICATGFTDGWCEYDFIDNVNERCTVFETHADDPNDPTDGRSNHGNCEVDVDECASNPCKHGATCADSTTNSVNVSKHAYQCSCTLGFSNGLCDNQLQRMSPVLYANFYAKNCSVFESEDDTSLGGNCDVDVDECASKPCHNGATCTESNVDHDYAVNEYTCMCAVGYASG